MTFIASFHDSNTDGPIFSFLLTARSSKLLELASRLKFETAQKKGQKYCF